MQKEIGSVCDFLLTIDTINLGGCLIAAYSIYLYLDKPKDFQLVSINRKNTNEDIYQYRNTVEYINNRDEGLAEPSYHFAWTFDGLLSMYDVRGRLIQEHSKYYIVTFPNDMTDEFFYAAINHYNWNKKFDREVHIPYIEKNLLIDFKLSLENQMERVNFGISESCLPLGEICPI